jgi:hypothetical protein
VQLQPWGTLTGRVIDDEGRPQGRLEVTMISKGEFDPMRGPFPLGIPRIGPDGRFRIEKIIPGLVYEFQVHGEDRIFGTILEGVTLSSGETRDLGDVPIRAYSP